MPVSLLCELIKNCKILRISVQPQPHQFDFPLKTRAADYLLMRLHIYWHTWSPRVMSNLVLTIRCTKARYTSMRTSLLFVGVSWRTLKWYRRYARYRACASPFPLPLPFHCVKARIVPAIQLAAHAKRTPCTVGRNIVVSPHFFGVVRCSYLP